MNSEKRNRYLLCVLSIVITLLFSSCFENNTVSEKKTDDIGYKCKFIVSGDPDSYIRFASNLGLDELRERIKLVRPNQGICLIGDVGILSHFGDLLRKANVPSKIIRELE